MWRNRTEYGVFPQRHEPQSHCAFHPVLFLRIVWNVSVYTLYLPVHAGRCNLMSVWIWILSLVTSERVYPAPSFSIYPTHVSSRGVCMLWSFISLYPNCHWSLSWQTLIAELSFFSLPNAHNRSPPSQPIVGGGEKVQAIEEMSRMCVFQNNKRPETIKQSLPRWVYVGNNRSAGETETQVGGISPV